MWEILNHMSINVSEELDPNRIIEMRKRIIKLERENVATQAYTNRSMEDKISKIIEEEALKRY